MGCAGLVVTWIWLRVRCGDWIRGIVKDGEDVVCFGEGVEG